jgi:hypothetical protein
MGCERTLVNPGVDVPLAAQPVTGAPCAALVMLARDAREAPG